MGVIKAKKITQLREQRGLNQYELAALAGIAPSVVSRLERDLQGDFKISVLVSVAKALNVSVDDLLIEEYQAIEPQLQAELAAVIRDLEVYPAKVQRLAAGVIRGLLLSIENE